MSIDQDSHFMRRALEQAARATRSTLPNPSVGAVLAHDNKVYSEGYHHFFGGPHAEVNAIRAVSDVSALPKSTLYVTLEPCSHTGKTPPCVDLIIASKIPRVVVGCRDPFPAVSGRGIAALRAAGIKVCEDVLHDHCVVANRRFILAHRMKRPYIILKWAETADGFIAPDCGARTSISSHLSHQLVHYWRGQEMAIAVGSTTARVDNPRLTARHLDLYQKDELPPQQPTRVIIGNASLLPETLEIWKPAAPTIGFVPRESIIPKHERLWKACEYDPAKPLLPQICVSLYEQQILSLIVEGGALTLQHFLDAGLWDEIRLLRTPTNFGSGIKAPQEKSTARYTTAQHLATECGGDQLLIFTHPELAVRLGIGEAATALIRQAAARPAILTHFFQK